MGLERYTDEAERYADKAERYTDEGGTLCRWGRVGRWNAMPMTLTYSRLPGPYLWYFVRYVRPR